ncbi:Hypothetical predicted protein, partial [Pelobates cultripes]
TNREDVTLVGTQAKLYHYTTRRTNKEQHGREGERQRKAKKSQGKHTGTVSTDSREIECGSNTRRRDEPKDRMSDTIAPRGRYFLYAPHASHYPLLPTITRTSHTQDLGHNKQHRT